MNEAQRFAIDEVLISFIIKTYNEEKKIARCIESVLDAANGLSNPYEIIIADSASTDSTVDIAARYPVKIVQFKNPQDRGCGAGVQLGYQHSIGDLVFLLDGDMALQAGFLPAALKTLQNNDKLAGVAGLVSEVAIRNTFDELRVSSGASSVARDEPWLNGGGIYRRKAIDSAGGYAANRNLKGWEEAELGMRLRAAGWGLRRIAVSAVSHDGHSANVWSLLARHWKSKRLMANGVLFKSALSKPWLNKVILLLLHPLAVILGWLSLLALLVVPWRDPAGDLLIALAVIAGSVFIALSLKKKSVRQAFQSVVIWHINAAALLYGIFLPVVSPTTALESLVLHEGSCETNEVHGLNRGR